MDSAQKKPDACFVDVFTYLAPPPPPPLPDDPMLSVSLEEASGQLPERPLLLLRCFLELLLEGFVCQAVDSSPHSSESYSESEGPPSESDIWKTGRIYFGALTKI